MRCESADVLGQAIHLFVRHVPCRFEHHVFEKMGESRTARRIVLTADVVPNMDRNGRARIILDRHDFETVGKSTLANIQRSDLHLREASDRTERDQKGQ